MGKPVWSALCLASTAHNINYMVLVGAIVVCLYDLQRIFSAVSSAQRVLSGVHIICTNFAQSHMVCIKQCTRQCHWRRSCENDVGLFVCITLDVGTHGRCAGLLCSCSGFFYSRMCGHACIVLRDNGVCNPIWFDASAIPNACAWYCMCCS